MSTQSHPCDPASIAAETLALLGSGDQTVPFSSRDPAFDLDRAYRASAELRAARIARGERPLGRKIGFTNRTIWPEYDVWQPIWSEVWDTTVRDLPPAGEAFVLAGLAEPRIEPEIVFAFASAPRLGMDVDELLGCIDWVAHGFEIVQSIYPQWKFQAADTVAGYGLHGALLIGPRHRIADAPASWRQTLSTFEIDLSCDGSVVDRGRAANVLDGPLSALSHLITGITERHEQAPLAAGDIVTTGTLTRAMPIEPGQTWSTRLYGIDIDGISVTFG